MPSDCSSLITVYREDLASRHYARRTIGTYERWLRRYLRFNLLRHPRQMGGPEINAFLTHLAGCSPRSLTLLGGVERFNGCCQGR